MAWTNSYAKVTLFQTEYHIELTAEMTHYQSMKHNNISPGALEKMAPSEGRREKFWCEKTRFYAKKPHILSNCGGRREILGCFVWKNTILRQKKHILSNCGGRCENFWGISCGKSRFYAKKSYFFQFPPGSAPVHPIHLMIRHKTGWTNLRRITRWTQRDSQNDISFRIVVSNNYLKQHSLDLNTNDICSNVMYILSNFSSNAV